MITLAPDDLPGWVRLAEDSLAQGQCHQALAAAGRVLQLAAERPDGYGLAVQALAGLGRHRDAYRLLERLPAHLTQDPNLRYARALSADWLGWTERAVAAYQAVLAVCPQHLGAFNNLIALSTRTQQWDLLDQTLAAFLHACPHEPSAHRFAAERAVSQGSFDLARLHLAQALHCAAVAHHPEHADLADTAACQDYLLGLLAHGLPDGGLGASRAPCPEQGGAMQAVMGRWVRFSPKEAEDDTLHTVRDAWLALQRHAQACWAWDDRASYTEAFLAWLRSQPLVSDSALRQIRSIELMGLPHAPHDERRLGDALAARLVQRLGHRVKPAPVPDVQALGQRRIRLAYLSPDACDHIAGAMLLRLLQAHDRTRYEVWLVATGRGTPTDAITRAMMDAVDHFLDARVLSDEQLIDTLRHVQLDVVVDTAGWYPLSRLAPLAARVAPVQVAYLGYPATYGGQLADYFVADRCILPAEHAASFAEQVIYLHGPLAAFERRLSAEQVRQAQARATPARPEGTVVLASLNNHWKIEPDVLASWCRILQAVPQACLWLLDHERPARERLLAAVARHGVDPARLVFVPREPAAQHLARVAGVDLFLDTWVCNAMSTAASVLSVGVPIVTRRGTSYASQACAGIMRHLELDALAVDDADAYEALVIDLARDPQRLRAIKQRLLAQVQDHRLFDVTAHAREMEAMYPLLLVQRAEDGPASFCMLDQEGR